MSTRLEAAPQGRPLDPPPPDDRLFVAIVSGTVPPRTRDGRSWDQVFGSLPDPYVKLKVDGAEIIRTDASSDTLSPTWESSPRGNFPIAAGAAVEVELWDSSALNDTPIGLKKFTLTADMIAEGEIELELSGEASVKVQLGPARAIWGAGFWYELRNSSSYVTRLIDASPASRAGMQVGDRILAIGGKQVDQLSPDEVRSALGSIPVDGVALTLQHGDGATLQATVKEGPIYPLFKDQKYLSVVPH
jgi:membrane-associated protease RseP (regulator of RpoE activity)